MEPRETEAHPVSADPGLVAGFLIGCYLLQACHALCNRGLQRSAQRWMKLAWIHIVTGQMCDKLRRIKGGSYGEETLTSWKHDVLEQGIHQELTEFLGL